jgi:hypothetical protein
MKHDEIKQVGDSWYIRKWKSGLTGKTCFASCFGDDEQVAQCGNIFYSKYQLKKDMKRGNCI